MSGADKLREKILVEAASQAEQVLGEAHAKAAEIIAKGEAAAAVKVKSMLEQARVQADEHRRRAQIIAELDARKAILGAKEDMIEDTFSKAIERLRKLDQQAYEELIFPMLLAASQTGMEQVIVSQNDRGRFTPEFMERVNKALLQQGKQGGLILSGETREMQGGFTLLIGDVEINNSFNSILRMQRDQLEPDVAAILFS